MALAALTLVTLTLLLALSGFTKMAVGLSFTLAAVLAKLSMLEASAFSHLPTYVMNEIAPMMLSAAGLSMIANSWKRAPSGRKLATVFIPVALFQLAAASVLAAPFLMDISPSSVSIALESLTIAYVAVVLLAASRVTVITTSLLKEAGPGFEKFTLGLSRASSLLGGLGCALFLLSHLVRISSGPEVLASLSDPAVALALSGGASMAVAVLLGTTSSLVARHRVHRELTRILPALEELWHRAMTGAEHLAHPLEGKGPSDRAYRMTMEIHDAASSDQGEVERLSEEDYLLLEETEDLLKGSVSLSSRRF